MEDNQKLKGRINSIQVLRGLACLFVILRHTQTTTFGQPCLDYFMLISGFVMMLSTENHGAENYWKKRLIRILPLYYGATVFTSILIIVLPGLFHSYEVSIEYFIKSLLFIPYFHNGITGPVLEIGWTLYFEMLFYLFFWIALKISHKYRGIIASVFLIIFALAGYLFELPEVFEYLAHPIIIDFALGMFAYHLWKYIVNKTEKFQGLLKNNTLITIVVYLIYIVTFIFMDWLNKLPIARSLTSGSMGALVLLLFCLLDEYIRPCKVLILIGNTGYEVYLLHVFVVRAIGIVLGKILPLNIFTGLLNVFLTVLVIEVGLKLYKVVFKRENKKL